MPRICALFTKHIQIMVLFLLFTYTITAYYRLHAFLDCRCVDQRPIDMNSVRKVRVQLCKRFLFSIQMCRLVDFLNFTQ